MREDIALIGGIPIEIVENLTHAVGNVTMGHAVGSGVRTFQGDHYKKPEQIQIKCMFLGTDKYSKKLALEQIVALGVPVPFVSGLTALPLVRIMSLVFVQTAAKKDLNDGAPIVDFTCTLQEYKVNYFLKLGVKLAWLAWILAAHPDRSTGRVLLPSPPAADNIAEIVPSEYIADEYTADDTTGLNLGKGASDTWTTAQLAAANALNKRFDKIPFNPDGAFPQVIKLAYPNGQSHATTFNNVSNLPATYDGYVFPLFRTAQTTQLIITISVSQTILGNTVTMAVKEDTIERLKIRIQAGVKYNVGMYQITFNEVDIKQENIQPQNGTGGSFGSKLEGGIRIIE